MKIANKVVMTRTSFAAVSKGIRITSLEKSLTGNNEDIEKESKRSLDDYQKSFDFGILDTKKKAPSVMDTNRALHEVDGGRTCNLRIDRTMENVVTVYRTNTYRFV